MMKKWSTVVVVVFTTISITYGQSLPMGSTGGSRIFFRPGSYAFVTELPKAPPETIGDFYLDNEWLRGDIYLREEMKLESLFFRYNAKENYFEIKTDNEVKVLPGNRVISFDWVHNQNESDGKYANASQYNWNGTIINNFLKVVYDGQYGLLMGDRFKVIPGNYNAALNVGERNDKIVKEKVYYFSHNGELLKVDSNRKRFLNDLQAFSGQDINSLTKGHKINPKDMEDLISLARKLNER